MTTAHRATFHAAIGGKEQGGGRYISGVSRTHVHDQKSQMSIKLRAPASKGGDAVPADFRAALEAKEAEHLKAIGRTAQGSRAPALLPPPPPVDDDDDDEDQALIIDPEDADDKQRAPAGKAAAESDEDSDEDDDDDELELMRELERIKKERAAEAAKKEREAADEAAAEADSSILQSNPLLDPTARGGGASSFAVKRRWDDDVVFKNQGREPKKEGRRFINDTVRNDFHKRFLNKYVK